MKWLSIIIVVMFAGAFAYWWFHDDASSYAGTPMGPPKAFVKAALDDDTRAAAEQCDPSIEEKAVDVAKRLKNEGVDYRAVAFKDTESEGGLTTYTALVNGKFLTVGVDQDSAGRWVIKLIDFSK